MKKLFVFLLAAACLGGQLLCAQTKIDLSKQKGVVPVVNGGTGNAGQTAASTSPDAIRFGQVQTSTSSPGQNVAISNTGSNPVNVSSVALSGTGAAHFSTSNFCIGVLDSGATCVEQAQYNPLTAISEVATITVTTNAPVQPNNPLTIALSGTGIGTASFALSVNCAGTGSGTITSGETPPLINATCTNGTAGGVTSNNYATGSVVALTGTSTDGGTAGNFSGGSCAANPCNVTVSAATTVTGSFTAPASQVTLNVTGLGTGTGTITSDVADAGGIINCLSTSGVTTSSGGTGCSGTFPQGTVIILTETPSGTNTFAGWTGGVGCTVASTCTLTLNSSQTVTANFAQAVVALSIVQTCVPGTTGTNKQTCTWSAAQRVGDTIMCAPDWGGNTVTVSSVADTSLNTYTQLASSPKTAGTSLTEVFYHADNIAAAAAGANTTTFNLSGAPAGLEMKCIEYAGLTTSPLDVQAGASGTSGTALNSGPVTTNVANDLLLSASMVGSGINAVSSGWTQEILHNGNDMEDLRNQAIGSYSNTPTQSTSGAWIDYISAWKVQGTGSQQPPSITVIGGGSGSGSVALPSGTCTISAGVASGSCSASVGSGSSVTLTATASTGSVFSTWTGVPGCSTSATCTIPNITTGITIIANFSLSGVQNYYVSTSGSGTACTVTAPCATIAQAQSTAGLGPSGTQVNVAPGTYHADLSLTKSGSSASARMTYVSTVQYGAIITTTDTGNIVQVTANWVDFKNFEVIGDSGSSYGIIFYGTNNRAIGNKVHNIEGNLACGSGGAAGIDFQVAATNSSAIGNTVFNVTENAVVPCNHNQGIYPASDFGIVENNIVNNVASDCISMWHGSNHMVISNNTVFQCKTGAGINMGTGDAGAPVGGIVSSSIVNNIVYDIPHYGIRETGGIGPNNIYRNNIVFGIGISNYLFQTGSCINCINSNPLFVNYLANGTGDYHIQSTSPGVNAGTTSCSTGSGAINPCVPSIAIDGTIRPQGPAVDIGAYER